MKVEFPDNMYLGKPINLNVSNEGDPLSDVLVYADDVHQGKTDIGGNIRFTLERDIRAFYHPSHRMELILMKGYDNRDRRRWIAPETEHMVTYPFKQCGGDFGYFMLFLSDEEYDEVNYNPGLPITNATLVNEKWGHLYPTSMNDMITLHTKEPWENNQNCIKFKMTVAIDGIYARDSYSSYDHKSTFGRLWHEGGHDLFNMRHTHDYDITKHGGGYDLKGNTAQACIMCQNQWFFCPICRSKIRAYYPNVNAWYTNEEKMDIIENHLYWWERDRYNSGGSRYVSQCHQPQQNCGHIRRP